jgi:hypothetical protein
MPLHESSCDIAALAAGEPEAVVLGEQRMLAAKIAPRGPDRPDPARS